MVDRYRSLGARMLQEPHGAYVTHEDYQRLEAENEKLRIACSTGWGGGSMKSDMPCNCKGNYTCIKHTMENAENPKFKRLEAELAECKAEIHRARTDSSYWCKFNTISAHDAIRNENDALRARCERLEAIAYPDGPGEAAISCKRYREIEAKYEQLVAERDALIMHIRKLEATNNDLRNKLVDASHASRWKDECHAMRAGDMAAEYDELSEKVAVLIEAAESVIAVSDRKHAYWDKLKEAIAALKKH